MKASFAGLLLLVSLGLLVASSGIVEMGGGVWRGSWHGSSHRSSHR